MAKYNRYAVTDPEPAVSIGAWSLLADLRQILCRRLADRAQELGNLVPSRIQGLLAESVSHWREVSQKDESTRSQVAALVNYLEQETGQVLNLKEQREWALLFERLIVPYVISVTDEQKVHPWFPDNSFLEVYYEEFVKHADDARPTVPLFLTEETISSIHPSPATYQSLLPPADSVDQVKFRLASGMRALQSKLIGAFDHALTKDSQKIDRLVGNGAALMYAIRDESESPLGLICFSSPVIGLYHELLLPPSVKEVLPEERFRRSIYICPAVLDENDQAWLDSLDDGSSSSGVQAETNPLISNISLESGRKVDLLICRTCAREEGNSSCVFLDMNSWLYPTLGTFLGGLKQIAARAELEPLQKYAANLSHVLHTPISTITTSFYYHINKLSPDEAELKTRLEKLNGSLFILRAIAESTQRHFQLQRQGASDVLATPWEKQAEEQKTDLLSIVADMETIPIFEKLFQSEITLRKQFVGHPTPVSGYEGDWYIILYTLLKNAFRGADLMKSEQDAASSMSVTLNLIYPDDITKTFSLEIRNPSLALDQELLNVMRQCLAGRLSRIPQDIYRKNSSGGFGVGLGIVGAVVSANGFTATVEQDAGSMEVVVRINNIPLR